MLVPAGVAAATVIAADTVMLAPGGIVPRFRLIISSGSQTPLFETLCVQVAATDPDERTSALKEFTPVGVGACSSTPATAATPLFATVICAVSGSPGRTRSGPISIEIVRAASAS